MTRYRVILENYEGNCKRVIVASTSRRATVADYLACFALGAVLGGIFFLFI